MKRHYDLESLSNAVDRLIGSRDTFIVPSIRDVLGPGTISSIRFELFQEGRYQLIFRVRCTTSAKRRASFGFVVAKNAEEHSRVAKREHENLQWLQKRLGNIVVCPLRGGVVFLPDRFRRKSEGREVYAYMTRWLDGYHELGVGKDLKFFINEARPQSFSLRDTEELKRQMIEIIAKSFDPKSKQCMAIPEVASGDFVVTRSKRSVPKLKLIACRQLGRRLSPPKVVDKIVTAHWPWGNRHFFLAPENPKILLDGLAAALGRDESRRWMRLYKAAVESGRYRESKHLTLDDLERLGL